MSDTILEQIRHRFINFKRMQFGRPNERFVYKCVEQKFKILSEL